jgi:hypothetical protein
MQIAHRETAYMKARTCLKLYIGRSAGDVDVVLHNDRAVKLVVAAAVLIRVALTPCCRAISDEEILSNGVCEKCKLLEY